MTRRFCVTGDERMLKDFLLSQARVSVTALKKIKYGGLYVNGERVTVRARVRDGDTVEIVYPAETASDIPPIDIPLNIIYEDECMLAVAKPTNMPVHPSRGNSLPTLAGAVMHYYRDMPFVFRAVNRLDRETSGIVLIAKTGEAAYHLSESMKKGEFEKEYLAVIDGRIEPPSGVIDAPIARECEGSMRRIVHEGGKQAITQYRTLSTKEHTSLLEVRPLTGRTHQIRVHLAHIGHPLSDDFLYGVRREGAVYRLHAHRLTLPHPETRGRITLCAPCPFVSEFNCPIEEEEKP